MNTRRASFGMPITSRAALRTPTFAGRRGPLPGFPANLGETALETRERRRQGLSTAASGVAAAAGATAAIPFFPWTQIAGAGIGVVAAAMKIAATLRSRGSKALAGDESAVRGFARRAERWSRRKRKKGAAKLLKLARRYKKLQARYKRKKAAHKSRKYVRLQKRMAVLRLKLAVLYALEFNDRRAATGSASQRRADRQESAADRRAAAADAEAARDEGIDEAPGISPWVVGAAGAAAAVVVLALVRR